MSKLIQDIKYAGGIAWVEASNNYAGVNVRVCFGNVKVMINQKNSKITLRFPDVTSHMTGTTKYTNQYVEDLDKFLGEFVIQSRKTITKHNYDNLSGLTIHEFEVDTNKCNGSVFLGIMNLYKAMSETPLVPVSYCILKKESKLRFYQRLVASQVLMPDYKDVVPYYRPHSHGQQSTFRTQHLIGIRGLKLSFIVDYWKKIGLMSKEQSLAVVNSYAGYLPIETSNYRMLPSPYSSTVNMNDISILRPINEANIQSLLRLPV